MTTHSVHIVCSTNCVNCTITNHDQYSLTDGMNHTEDDDVTATSHNKTSSNESYSRAGEPYLRISEPYSRAGEPYSRASEPYTSDNLSRLRAGYKLLSEPSSVVKFNFNSQQVSGDLPLLFVELVHLFLQSQPSLLN